MAGWTRAPYSGRPFPPAVVQRTYRPPEDRSSRPDLAHQRPSGINARSPRQTDRCRCPQTAAGRTGCSPERPNPASAINAWLPRGTANGRRPARRRESAPAESARSNPRVARRCNPPDRLAFCGCRALASRFSDQRLFVDIRQGFGSQVPQVAELLEDLRRLFQCLLPASRTNRQRVLRSVVFLDALQCFYDVRRTKRNETGDSLVLQDLRREQPERGLEHPRLELGRRCRP